MSVVKKSKLDLLVRVRYANPIPPPPCPPKLLNIPTNPNRYALPEFLDAIADDAPLPMVLDAECGMPLDLSHWDSLWDDEADDTDLHPDPERLPALDAKDVFLLEEIAGPATFANGPNGSAAAAAASAGPSTPASTHVSWLRKTEYLSREISTRAQGVESTAYTPPPTVDISREAQLRDIEASFAANSDEFDLATLKHPSKPGLTAVESLDVLPDAEIWSNQYDLFRFSERPGDRPVEVEDPRLDCAILRPMKSDHDAFLAYYLTHDDAAAEELKGDRASLQPYDVPPDQTETLFNFIRDYETVKVEQELQNEYHLVLDDGLDGTRPKGAYYKDIERKMVLKKKRQHAYEEYSDKWELIRFKHAELEPEEVEERDDALAEVMDPNYIASMMMIRDEEADADESLAQQTEQVSLNGAEAVDIDVES